MTTNKTLKRMCTKRDNFLYFPYAFVGQKLPLVGCSLPCIQPLIGGKLPSVLNKHIRGFTLVELIITLVVAGLLGALAIPNMRSFVQNNRISSQSNSLLADLNYAHDQAILRQRNVVLCRSANATAAVPKCDTLGTPNWENGWIVFVDNPTPANVYNNDFLVADGDMLLLVRGILEGENTLRPSRVEINNYVAYAANSGAVMLDRVVAGTSPYHFKLCDVRGNNNARGIVLSQIGSPRIVRGSSFQEFDMAGVATTFPLACP